MSNFDICVNRNLQAKELEVRGQVQAAIQLYEMNVSDNFEGSHPYYRLSAIYHKQKRYADEIRVLERAIYVFENIVYKNRADRKDKLAKFKEKLKKAKDAYKKATK